MQGREGLPLELAGGGIIDSGQGGKIKRKRNETKRNRPQNEQGYAWNGEPVPEVLSVGIPNMLSVGCRYRDSTKPYRMFRSGILRPYRTLPKASAECLRGKYPRYTLVRTLPFRTHLRVGKPKLCSLSFSLPQPLFVPMPLVVLKETRLRETVYRKRMARWRCASHVLIGSKTNKQTNKQYN